MIRLLCVFLVALFSFSTTHAQFSSANDAQWVIGLETNFIMKRDRGDSFAKQFSSIGINVEKPLGQFSMSMGVHIRKNKGQGIKQPQNIIESRSQSEQMKTMHFYNVSQIKPSYLTFKNRLIYRLPCNCIDLFVGYHVDVLIGREEEVLYKATVKSPDAVSERSYYELKDVVHGYSIGFGMALPINDNMKLSFRPEYIWFGKAGTDRSSFFVDDYSVLMTNVAFLYGFN